MEISNIEFKFFTLYYTTKMEILQIKFSFLTQGHQFSSDFRAENPFAMQQIQPFQKRLFSSVKMWGLEMQQMQSSEKRI